MKTEGIISLTTHEARAACIDQTVTSLVRQGEAVGLRVCLTVAEGVSSRFTAGTSELLGRGAFDLIETERDYGSNMKYMFSMVKYPDLPVICVDDDNVFVDGTLAGMMRWHRLVPKAIVCRRYREIAWNQDGSIGQMTFRSYPLHKCTSLPRGFLEVVRNGFPEHCAGCLYPPGALLPLGDEELAEAAEKAPHDDDVFAHILALRRGVPTVLIHDPAYLATQRDKTDPILKMTGLWTNGGNGTRTTGALRRFEPELQAARFQCGLPI